MDPQEKIHTPFTPEQVDQLNRYQISGVWHPFTCYNGHTLVARGDGWFCPMDIAARQDWAYWWMADKEYLDTAVTTV